MRSPVSAMKWLELDEVDSTQAVAEKLLKEGSDFGAVIAHNQVKGRGRLGREWLSEREASLTISLIFRDYADHPRPYLIGMSVAIAAAGAIHGMLQWPNDLILGDRKAGGVLTDIFSDAKGRRIPVVGVGINLNQSSFPPEIADFATSVHLYHGGAYEPQAIAGDIERRLERLPEPTDWQSLRPAWQLFDHTPGKKYKMLDGRLATALGIGPEGQLLASIEGETVAILAADAMFGSQVKSEK